MDEQNVPMVPKRPFFNFGYQPQHSLSRVNRVQNQALQPGDTADKIQLFPSA